MPLIDVVFLLLTFFIYAMVVMVEFKSSGVDLISVEGADQAADQELVLLEIDGNGSVLIEGLPIAEDELDGRLREIAGRADMPPVSVMLHDVEASVDRGPILFRLEDRIRRAGIHKVFRVKLEGGSGVSP